MPKQEQVVQLGRFPRTEMPRCLWAGGTLCPHIQNEPKEEIKGRGIVPIPGLPNAFWISCARPLSVERSHVSHCVEISVKLWRARALT